MDRIIVYCIYNINWSRSMVVSMRYRTMLVSVQYYFQLKFVGHLTVATVPTLFVYFVFEHTSSFRLQWFTENRAEISIWNSLFQLVNCEHLWNSKDGGVRLFDILNIISLVSNYSHIVSKSLWSGCMSTDIGSKVAKIDTIFYWAIRP